MIGQAEIETLASVHGNPNNRVGPLSIRPRGQPCFALRSGGPKLCRMLAVRGIHSVAVLTVICIFHAVSKLRTPPDHDPTDNILRKIQALAIADWQRVQDTVKNTHWKGQWGESRAMLRTCASVSGKVMLCGLLIVAGAARAEEKPDEGIQLATCGGQDLAPATDGISPDSGVRISVSRAGNTVGTATFYSRAQTVGTGKAIVVSPRKAPTNATFSIALPSPLNSLLSSSIHDLTAMPSLMPVSASAITSVFGMRHNPFTGYFQPHRGVDLAAPYGTPIVATMDGTVAASGWHGGYGLLVSLDNASGLETRYGHMSRLAVSQGEQVHRGEVIGYVGSTGHSTGPHVHYEIRVGGQPINPARYLPSR